MYKIYTKYQAAARAPRGRGGAGGPAAAWCFVYFESIRKYFNIFCIDVAIFVYILVFVCYLFAILLLKVLLFVCYVFAICLPYLLFHVKYPELPTLDSRLIQQCHF